MLLVSNRIIEQLGVQFYSEVGLPAIYEATSRHIQAFLHTGISSINHHPIG